MLKKLFLDLNNFKANLGSVERGDSIELNIKLLDSEDYSRSKFRVLGAKADGKYVEQIEGINLEEKDLKIVLEDQFVNCEGIVKLELNVVSSETEITTKEFYFFVSNTMNSEIIDSADSIPTLEKVSKYVDDAVNNLDALKEASADITIINSEFKENEIKRKANELLRERSEKERVRLESIRTTEEADRLKSEAERKEAENNRKVAESNRKLAENTRKTNEANRVRAELNRQSLFEENEEIRNENENLRIEAEKERKLTFSNNNKFESERVEAEKLRAIAEDKRVTAEKARANAEEERIKAETRRENTYTDFNDSEVERRNNEANRVRAEAERVNAESGRNELFNSNEEKRNNTFVESERARERAFNEAQSNRNEAYEESERVREEAFKVSEAARDEAEEGRVEAESERVKSEKARVLADEERNTTFTQKEEERNNTFTQNETNRNTTFTQSEEERKTTFEEAENARKVAESKRVAAETGRVEAEKLRVTAETERVEAENLRATAEEERVAAEQIREEKFAGFENKISANTKELKGARTATTGEKFNSLDERIDCEVYRLNKKIDVTMLQQEDKGSHLVENTVEGMTTDMVIKGRTLQNLVKYKLNNQKVGSTSMSATLCTNEMFKINTTYTIIYTINSIESGTGKTTLNFSGGMTSPDITLKSSDLVGTHKQTFTLNTLPSTKYRNVSLYHIDSNTTKFISDVIIIEGEVEFTLNYFEGIKSFGQQEKKISILSHGKNLFDYNKLSGGNIVTFNNKKCYKYIDNANNFSLPINGVLGKQYTLSIKIYRDEDKKDKSCNVEFVYSDGTKDSKTFINGALVTYITTLGKRLIKIKGNFNYGYNCYIDLECTQLEEGTQFTSFEKYQSDKKDILLSQYGFDEGLRGLEFITDKVDSINLKVIKNIEKIILDENTTININEQNDTFISFIIAIPNMETDSNYTQPLSPRNSMCNKMAWIRRAWDFNDPLSSSLEGYSISNVHSDVYIKIKKDKLSTANIEGIKLLLKQWKDDGEPLILYYQLKTPVETPLDESINLKVFNEKTYVSFENSISGTSSFKAPVDTKTTIARLNRENRALEEENKTLRQDFESTTLSLTDSDLELVKQNVDIDFRLMEVEFALDIPQATLSSNINFKKKGEVKSMARTPYAMMKIVILSGDYDREDYIHKVGKYYERGRMTKEEYDELMSLMTADEVISK
ncbi:hypothetical protein [Clostridium perfringens]|uniref:hypothetical protein n=1 Tax=Clostridium perfringens TaxID=1502 RepID=UPI0019D6DBE7|nr:hypothetical protein [Clostridium perfringens]